MKKLIPKDSILLPDSAKLVFRGVIFDVYQWPQTMYDGSSETFEMLKRADTVSAICIVDNQILVLDDTQPHTGNRITFPGGRVDETDDSIEAAAQREVKEETGYSFNNWRLIRVWQPHGKQEWFIHLLLAWDVADKAEPQLDAGEKITVHKRSLNLVKGLVTSQVGHLGETAEIFDHLNSLDELLALPEYSGQLVDR